MSGKKKHTEGTQFKDQSGHEPPAFPSTHTKDNIHRPSELLTDTSTLLSLFPPTELSTPNTHPYVPVAPPPTVSLRPPPKPDSPVSSSPSIPTTQSFSPGSHIKQRYRIVKPLGSGGLGDIFLVKDTQTNTTYALKLLRVDLHPDSKLNFIKEYQMLQKLSHPGIVRTYQYDEDAQQGCVFYLMEHVEGRTLQEIIDERVSTQTGPPFTASEALNFLQKIASPIRYIHQKGILHRDLKPANIMFDAHQHIRILDFGIAKDTASLQQTEHHKRMGTSFYIAPERVMEAHNVSEAADVYSVGVILYVMLTGMLPVGIAETPSAINPSLNEAFDALLRKAMHPRWQHRYPSIDALEKDFRHELRKQLAPSFDNFPASQAIPPELNHKTGAHPIYTPLPRKHALRPTSTQHTSQIPKIPLNKTNSPHKQTLPIDILTTSQTQTNPTRKPLPTQERVQPTQLLQLNERPTAMAFSKEHPLFAAATENGHIAIWEVSSWYQLHRMKASESPIKSIQWSPKGNNLAVLNNDGEIQLLDPLTPNKQFTLPLRKHTNIIQWSHNSTQLYLAHENQLYLWDIASGSHPEPFGNHKTPIRSMTQPLESQAPNQSMLLTIEKNGTTHLWDINSGKDTLAFDVGPVSPTSIAIHPTEALVFVGTETGEIDVWSYSSQQLVHSWKAHHAPITHLWIQTQGRWLLSADNSQSIHQWSLADWQRRNTFATRQQSLTAAAVSPKQKWLTASYNQEAIALWSLRQQKEL